MQNEDYDFGPKLDSDTKLGSIKEERWEETFKRR